MSEQLNTLVDNKALQVQDNPVLQGNFASVDTENSFDVLVVIGSIPKNLQGTLLRNGPNPSPPAPITIGSWVTPCCTLYI